MPLYEYLCHACDSRFEAYLRAWSDSPTCPECQGVAVERLLSAFAVGAGSAASAPSSGGACCGRGGCGCRS